MTSEEDFIRHTDLYRVGIIERHTVSIGYINRVITTSHVFVGVKMTASQNVNVLT